MMRLRLSVVLASGLALGALAACQSPSAPEPGVDAVATVGSAAVRTVEPGLIFGANFGAWVGAEKLGATTRDLIRDLRPSVARFPGGNLSNNFCWVEQKASDNDHVVWSDWSWGTSTDQFISLIQDLGARPMFSLNPFDHTIDGQPHAAAGEAEGLARRFLAGGFAGAFYEVGNENDGSWNPMLTVNEYASRFVLLAGAVKSIDPSAQLMGPVGSGPGSSWITGFLDRLTALAATDLLDWVCYHHYGGWISNSNSAGIDLNNPQDYRDDLSALRADLDTRGLGRVKIAVTEINAAIWDTGCTRDQFTVKQALWLADALGVSMAKADAVNVWIHLHPGADPHSLIDSDPSQPVATRNYWPVALAAWALSGTDPHAAVEVLPVSLDAATSVLTAYAVRKADLTLGVLLLNKTGRSLSVAVDVPAAPRSVAGRLLGAAAYDAGRGTSAANIALSGRRLTVTVPATAIVGLDVR